MNQIDNFQPRTLGDIFLKILEQMSQDEEKKNFIKKVSTLMDVPEYAEYFNCCVSNALGHPTSIEASTVDSAIDCLIQSYELDIDNNQEWGQEQKMMQTTLMHKFMDEYRNLAKCFIASHNLLR